MDPTDLTASILREIVKANSRLDQTTARIDQTILRIEEMGDELRRAVVESEARTATAIAAVSGTLNDIEELLAG